MRTMKLSARYGQAIDSCSDNGYDYARRFGGPDARARGSTAASAT